MKEYKIFCTSLNLNLNTHLNENEGLGVLRLLRSIFLASLSVTLELMRRL